MCDRDSTRKPRLSGVELRIHKGPLPQTHIMEGIEFMIPQNHAPRSFLYQCSLHKSSPSGVGAFMGICRNWCCA